MNDNSKLVQNRSFSAVPRLLKELKGSVVLIKYGGNAMVDDEAAGNVYDQIVTLCEYGIKPVIVHGGGPFIKKLLNDASIDSVFVEGHRKTDGRMLEYVEMALSGKVNGQIVRELNSRGLRAVGLSGKDASMVRATRRFHISGEQGDELKKDIGFVGDVESIDTGLISDLLDRKYLPVVAPLGTGRDGQDYNINADMFAGHLAGALHCTAFIALTDVDGLMEDPDKPDSKIETISVDRAREEIGKSIVGGMIPKVESSLIALEKGVKRAHIINGMKTDTLLMELLSEKRNGTCIVS